MVRTIPVGHNPSAIADGLGYLWIANQGDGTVTRIDPSGRVAARVIPVGAEPDGIAVGDGAVWVANEFDNTVSRIDPNSLSTSTIAVGVGPNGIAVTATAVWVADSLDLTVARIDLAHNNSVTKVETGDSPTAVAEFHGAIWVSNAGDATISRLDETTGRVTKTYAFGSSPNGLAVGGSTLWVSSKAFASAAHRGGTLTVATVTPDDGMSSIDPALAYDGDLYDGMAEVYDTLVALRKSTGLTGLDLVPDLAQQLPTPTDGGLTYVFQLRPNIEYSNGQPLRASDFRRGIERTLLVEPGSGDGYFTDIVGASACTQQPAQCDLSAGIVTDDSAGTVTIHLVKPDPDLLGALSITGFSTPVPPNTPMTQDVGTTAGARHRPVHDQPIHAEPVAHAEPQPALRSLVIRRPARRLPRRDRLEGVPEHPGRDRSGRRRKRRRCHLRQSHEQPECQRRPAAAGLPAAGRQHPVVRQPLTWCSTQRSRRSTTRSPARRSPKR